MKPILVGLLLLAIPVLALSQSSGTISAPTLGFMFDRDTGIVRTLVGVAGSATVGDPIDLGLPVTNVITLHDQHSVLAVPESGPFLLSMDLGVTPPLQRPIIGAAKSADITLSPNGKAAALAYRTGQLVEIVTGLPDHPAVTLEVTTTLVKAPLQRIAVNDAGNLLLMTFLENDRETIYRWNRSEGFRLLASTAEVGALGFVGASDAVYADRGTNEVFFAQDVKSGSVTQFLAGASDGVSGPIGVVASSTGGFFLANAGSGTIMTFGPNRRIIGSQQCSCDVSGVSLLSTGIFRLTDRWTQTIYLLDDTGSEPRLIFIPPLK